VGKLLLSLGRTKERSLISLEYVLIFLANGAMFPFFNLYLTKHLGWSGTRIGSVGALSAVLVMMSQPLWGRISDASEKHKVLAFAFAVSACLVILHPLAAGSFLIFLLVRLSHAVFIGSTTSMFDAIALDVLGEDRDTYGKYRLWGSLGFAAAALFMGKVYEVLGFSSMFFFNAVLVGAAGYVASNLGGAAAGREKEHGEASMELTKVLANPALLVLLGGVFLVQTANSAGETFLGVYLDAIGGSSSLVGSAFAVMAFVEIPTFLAAPKVVERFGYKQVLVMSTALFGLKLVLNALFPIPWLVLALQPLSGIGFAFFQVSSVLMVDALVPRQFRSTGQAVLSAVAWSVAGMSGGLIFGMLLDTAGIIAAFGIGGCVGLLGTLFIQCFVPGEAKRAPAADLEQKA
jgi:PPP family 3-phenylpropionic acid transporter